MNDRRNGEAAKPEEVQKAALRASKTVQTEPVRLHRNAFTSSGSLIMAWVFEKYIGESSGDIQTSYHPAQTAAQQECRGLWIDPHPIEPWLYRHPAQN